MTPIARTKIIVHRKITWLLLFFIFSLGVVSWLIYSNKKNIELTNQGTDETYEMIGRVQQMITFMAASDAAAEYAFTYGDHAAAMQRLEEAHQWLRTGLDSLQKPNLLHQDQQQNITILRKYIMDKIAMEDSLFRKIGGQDASAGAVEAGGPIAGRSLPGSSGAGERAGVDRQSAGPGQQQAILASMTARNTTITNLLRGMIKEERQLLGGRKARNDAENSRNATALIIGRLVCTLFIGYVLIRVNKDITERIRTQDRLMKAIQEAETAKKMQEQFLANMSHEIRTPMNGIKGMTDLLLDTPLTDKQNELARIIKHSANNLLVIINDILDFSKIKAGKLNIEKIDFCVEEVMDSAAALFDHRLKKKGLQLYIQLDPNLPESLNGDPHRLYQVLVNILGNAIKFTQYGHIDVKVALLQRTDNRAVLSFAVTDTGIGISAENLPYIFDSFSQAGQDISRRYGGTGLGLTICKQLLHLQGGDISVSSVVGQGTTFLFQLPYECPAPEDANKPAPSVLMHDYSNLLIGKSFLVVEDNEINQKLIDYVLKKAGGDVALANNGIEAIKCLEDGQNFDLIIMDLQMPEMDGYAATQYIRNDLHMKTPIIAMTATAMKGEHLQCIESGMNEYMTKPFEFTELYKRIGVLLG